MTSMASAALTSDRPWILVVIVLLMAGMNAVLDAVLMDLAGVFGLAMATSIVATTRAALMTAAVAASVLAARSLWKTLGRSAVAAACLAAPLWGLRLLPIAASAESFLSRSMVILAGAAIGAVVAAVLWRPILGPEWRSLTALRRRAARSAQSL